MVLSRPIHSELRTKRPGNRAFLFSAIWGAALALAACRTPETVTIRAGLLLDGRGGQMQDALVTVRGSRIRAVGPYQGGLVTYDFSRYAVLPGLIDGHVHISGYINRQGRVGRGGDGETPAQREAGRAANALATLRAGFTTVASMGSGADRELRAAINAGRIPGPRVLTSLSPIRDSSLSPGELRREVRRRHMQGADFIKIFNSRHIRGGGTPIFTLDQLTALCGEARNLKLRSFVHAHSDASIRAAVQAGCDAVEHGAFASAEGLGWLAQAELFFDPQCRLILRHYLDHRPWFEGEAGFDSTAFVLIEKLVPTFPAQIRAALGVPSLRLGFGSDAVAGAHGRNADDLVCRVREAGQPPMEALVTATSRTASALGLGEEIGTVAPGYRADLIALDGNPLQEIEAVLRVRFVMQRGQVVREDSPR